MNNTYYYTGIGSRKIPKQVRNKMYNLGAALGECEQEHNDPLFILRSGGADGADTAFEQGCASVNGQMQIFLPWKEFNNNPSPFYTIPDEAYTIAKDVYGPNWSRLKKSTKHFMARNVLQVIGPTLDINSMFVVCWTPDGCTTAEDRTKKTGGTGQAIALASELDIPVFNLYHENHVYDLLNLFEELIKH